MRKELEQKLVERWPLWFNTKGDPRQTRMADGFTHGLVRHPVAAMRGLGTTGRCISSGQPDASLKSCK
jgi:hypothetical protein